MAEPLTLESLFKEFDADGSGAVDATELKQMVEKLGMTVKASDLDKWIADADDDKSGQLEFNEFQTIMNKAANEQGGGMSLAAVLRRKQNSGPEMQWYTEKVGEKIVIDSATKTASRLATEGWSIQIMDGWLSTSTYDKASVLVEFVHLDGECYVGIVQRNVKHVAWEGKSTKAEDKDNDWDEFLKRAIVFSAADGSCSSKYKAGDSDKFLALCKFEVGQRLQFNLDLRAQKLEAEVLKMEGSEWTPKAHIETIEGRLPPEIGIVVVFGPSPAGKTEGVKVKIVGSSSEKTSRPTETPVSVSNESNAAAESEEVKAAQSMAN